MLNLIFIPVLYVILKTLLASLSKKKSEVRNEQLQVSLLAEIASTSDTRNRLLQARGPGLGRRLAVPNLVVTNEMAEISNTYRGRDFLYGKESGLICRELKRDCTGTR